VSYSFKTNGKAEGLDEAIEAIRTIISNHGGTLAKIASHRAGKQSVLQSDRSAETKISLASLNLPLNVLNPVKVQIRKISFWEIVLLLLYYSRQPLMYRHLVSLTSELGKPVSLDWLDTEFHRKRYKGLVRSQPVPETVERSYVINEPGRRKVETLLVKLKSPLKPEC